MANEYLKRIPTSTGNRKVFTWAAWLKKNEIDIGFGRLFEVGADTSNRSYFTFRDDDELEFVHRDSNSITDQLISDYEFMDPGSFAHLMIAVNTTASSTGDRIKIYVNGVLLTGYSTFNLPSANQEFDVNSLVGHYLGNSVNQAADLMGSMSDVFFIDGQALTPDVFGFYKDGKGYQSSGSTKATDFRPGQWSPHSPRKIKSEIERKGGFGVNGFYLPMNSSNNFGADFHTTPNTILKLKENLPQPKSEIDGGGNYTGALRDDPFKENLVLAIPGVINGLDNGFGDYSAEIRGSGSNKTVSGTNSPTVSSDASVYYGSSIKLVRASSQDVYATVSESIGSGDFTLETWVRFESRSQDINLFNLYSGSNRRFFVQVRVDNSARDLHTRFYNTSNAIGNGLDSVSIGWSDDHIGGWYHIAAVRESGTFRQFVNGVCVGTHSDSTNIGDIDTVRIGYMSGDGTKYLDGYFQDFRFYNTAKYKGGFDVPKPYTPVGIESWRAVPDNCKNNFCTLNPLDTSQLVPTNGNSSIDQSSGGWHSSLGTHYARSGKWYTEMRIDRLGWIMFGVEQTWLESRTRHIGGQTGSKGAALVYNTGNRGDISTNGTNSVYTGGDATAATGDIISIALDLDGNNVKFYKNNILQYDLSNILESGADYAFGVSAYSNVAATVNFGQNPTFSGQITAGTHTDSNGKGLFKYQPPAGYLALCDDNLPAPAIDPGKHFKCVLWTGDGNGGRSVPGVGFAPDLVWTKRRSAAASHFLFDSVRGPGKYLSSHSINAEGNDPINTLMSFDSDGFTSGNTNGMNQSTHDYVAWCWKAGGPAITNNDGTITSQVSANQDAGFSIVSTNGSGTAGHGLNATPQFMIQKRTASTSDWSIQHHEMMTTSTGKLLFTDAAVVASSTPYMFNANATTFEPIYTNQCISYCWTEIEGYSKFGSYIGNGNADGPFVYCGFKPALLIRKSATSTGGWYIVDSSRDPLNPNNTFLDAKDSDPDGTGTAADFLSNGFKIRNADVGTNKNGETFIFAAFAESPFQTANAK